MRHHSGFRTAVVTVVIGGFGLPLGATAHAAPSTPTLPRYRFVDPTPQAYYDAFGYSVALNGATLAIGAPRRDSGAGVVDIQTRTDTGAWETQATLSDPAGVPENFGASVALSQDTLVVGAPRHDHDAGTAYVYTRTGTAWGLEATLTQSNPAARAAFGESVAIAGDTVLVGMPTDSLRLPGGAVLFHRDPATSIWSRLRTLSAPPSALRMGVSVALHGDTALVGAPLTGPYRAGAVFVYTRGISGWQQTATLTPSNAVGNARFGFSVALSRGLAVVGAPWQGLQHGAAYVFAGSGATWTQAAALTGSETTGIEYFGHSVAISGTTVVIGAPYGPAPNTGRGYVFRPSGGTWVKTGTLVPWYPLWNAALGFSVAVDGTRALLGAWGARNSTGIVYLFNHLGRE